MHSKQCINGNQEFIGQGLSNMSHPHIKSLAPDTSDPRRSMKDIVNGESLECPQLKIIRIDGSLFFCAANYVSKMFEEIDGESPRHLLIVGAGISYIDVSGAMMLVQEAERRRSLNKVLYLCRLIPEIQLFLKQGGFIEEIGEGNIFESKHIALTEIFERLDMKNL